MRMCLTIGTANSRQYNALLHLACPSTRALRAAVDTCSSRSMSATGTIDQASELALCTFASRSFNPISIRRISGSSDIIPLTSDTYRQPFFHRSSMYMDKNLRAKKNVFLTILIFCRKIDKCLKNNKYQSFSRGEISWYLSQLYLHIEFFLAAPSSS